MILQGLLLTTAGLAAATPVNNLERNAPVSEVRFDSKQLLTSVAPLSKQLMSLSIEFGNTLDFFGDIGKPNQFSLNLLQNVADRARTPAILRIGGNTQDRTDFCNNCTETLTRLVVNNPNDPKTTEALKVTYNMNFFKVLTENVPSKSPLVFGLNFRNNSYPIAEAQVDAALKYLDQDLVMAYELGNEVNLYGPFRPKGYNAAAYSADMRYWLPRLHARSPEDVKFQFPSFAGPPQDFNSDLTIAELVKQGLPQSIPGIKYMSVHGYPYNICSPADSAKVNLTNFLDHNKTAHLVSQYSEEIAAARAVDKEMHMGETGSVACHGKDGVSNTLGAALWELDYALTGATAGINRFFLHMGQGDFFYSMWEPLGTEANPGPHIFPTYYAMLFVADLVGDLKDPKVSALPFLDTQSTIHFAVYAKGKLEKLVLINTQLAKSDQDRSSVAFNVKSVFGSKVKVQRLTGAASDARNGLTWAGQSVDATGKIRGDRKTERVSDGIVTVLASEAVIVERR